MASSLAVTTSLVAKAPPSSRKIPNYPLLTPKTTPSATLKAVSCKTTSHGFQVLKADRSMFPVFGSHQESDVRNDDVMFPYFFWIFGKDVDHQETDTRNDDVLFPYFFWIFGKDVDHHESDATKDDVLFPYFFWIFGKDGGHQEECDDMLMPFFWVFGKGQDEDDVRREKVGDDIIIPFKFIFGKGQDDDVQNEKAGDASEGRFITFGKGRDN